MPPESPSEDTDGEEAVHRSRHADPIDGFVWGTAVSSTRGADMERTVPVATDEATVATTPGTDGFEWCVGERGIDSADTDGDTALDPSLVTERRVEDRDEEAVARLTELRRDPTVGRWRRAASELDDGE